MAKPKLSRLSDDVKFPDHDGQKVAGVLLEIKNTGYGLEQSMQMEPVVLAGGDRVNLLISGVVSKFRYEHVDEDNPELGWTRVQIVRAETAQIVDADTVAGLLDAHRRKLSEAAGVPELDYTQTADGQTPGAPADDWEIDDLKTIGTPDAAARAAGEES